MVKSLQDNVGPDTHQTFDQLIASRRVHVFIYAAMSGSNETLDRKSVYERKLIVSSDFTMCYASLKPDSKPTTIDELFAC